MLSKSIDNPQVEVLTPAKLKIMTDPYVQERTIDEKVFLRAHAKLARNSRTTYEVILIILNLAVIILTVVRNEVILQTSLEGTKYILSIVMTILSIIAWVLIVMKYQITLVITNEKYRYNYGFGNFLWGRKGIAMVLELLINAIHPFPGVEGGQAVITVCVFMRLYPLIWSVSFFSLILKNKDVIRSSFISMKSYRVPKFQYSLGFRELMHRHFFITTLISLVVIVSSLAYMLDFSEKSVKDSAFDGYGKAVYWTLITVAGVGYGDFTPSTTNVVGMVVACIAAFAGVMIISSVSGVIVSALDISDSEKMAESVTKRNEATKELCKSCAELVKMAVKMYVHKRAQYERAQYQRVGKSSDAAVEDLAKQNFDMKGTMAMFFIKLAEKKKQMSQIKEEMIYTSKFIVTDAIRELLEYEKRQNRETKEVIFNLTQIRSAILTGSNSLGIKKILAEYKEQRTPTATKNLKPQRRKRSLQTGL